MKIDLDLNVSHLTRIEGHGNIVIRVEKGVVKEARWEVVETPRFFEIMMKNKRYQAVAPLAARICGICSISHTLCSLLATEKAFGTVVPPKAEKLRLLAKHGETLQSHTLHVLFLAAPDLFNVDSVIPLLESHPEVAGIACRLKGLGNEICDMVAGRSVHPITLQPGGITRIPPRNGLLECRERLKKSTEDLKTVAALFSTLKIPDFSRETEFLSLKGETCYPFAGEILITSDRIEGEAADYQRMTNEYVTADNTSKWTRLSRDSYAVGALARFNNNHRHLHPEALCLAASLGLEAPCFNPFMNNVAQLAECLHAVHEMICLIDELCEDKTTETIVPVNPRPGSGTGVVEAPRGTLFHHYEFDGNGRIVKADCVVPTTQNNANIHHDIQSLVARFASQGMPDTEIEKLCSMLVRSYDPCLSCAVH